MKSPKIPKPEPVKVMPTPDDEAIERARKKEIAKRVRQGGAFKTVLTSKNRDRLGV